MSNENKVIDESVQGEAILYSLNSNQAINGKKLYLESYGCQMNFADSEVVTSILQENGYTTTSNVKEAHTILLNTCAIRENAEHKIRHRLQVRA